MSIVTSLLDKTAFIGAIKPKIAFFESKLNSLRSLVPSLSLGGARQWYSPANADEFRRADLARRAFNESQGRLPVAR